jgi:uncharacterized protein YoxC
VTDLEERDEEERETGLRLSISMAIAAIMLMVAIVVGLGWRLNSISARLKHPAAALQQTDPTSGR